MSEAALFKSQLGETWVFVHPDIQTRFGADPLPGQPVFYDGTMTRIKCSFLGMLLGWASGLLTTGALCPYSGANVRAEIEVYKIAGSSDIYKTRTYYFDKNRRYVFKSRMHLSSEGELLEYVGKGIGMKIKVRERDGALFFTDLGYFLELGKWRVMLPRLLSPGDVELTHANLGPSQFEIFIRIAHPLWGELYNQHGVFVRRNA